MKTAFNIPFIQASQCLEGVNSYTILETNKVREIATGHFTSLRLRRKEISERSQILKLPENPKTQTQHQKSRL